MGTEGLTVLKTKVVTVLCDLYMWSISDLKLSYLSLPLYPQVALQNHWSIILTMWWKCYFGVSFNRHDKLYGLYGRIDTFSRKVLFSAECTIGMAWGLKGAKALCHYGHKVIRRKLKCLFIILKGWGRYLWLLRKTDLPHITCWITLQNYKWFQYFLVILEVLFS